MEDLYIDNIIFLRKDFDSDTRKWKDIPYGLVEFILWKWPSYQKKFTYSMQSNSNTYNILHNTQILKIKYFKIYVEPEKILENQINP